MLAHVKQEKDGAWKIHSLKEHLEGTAKLSAEFAAAFGLEKIGRLLGRVHDFGKASQAFQMKIAGQSGYKPEVYVDPHVDHSTAGAQYLSEKYGAYGHILAYIVAGHHGGLPNGYDEMDSCLHKRLMKEVEEYKKSLPGVELPEILDLMDLRPVKSAGTNLNLPFLIRMLYSCLVDGDFLDTESFMSPEQNDQRVKNAVSLSDLRTKLNEYLPSLKSDTAINKKRADILKWCRTASQSETGLFSLTVPTGGGKTLSSMAFALDHAVKNDLRRVIYVIPYTSIITQNADIFRKIFGFENVLEHHSNLDPDKETPLNRLSSQNWDAPIIVTTNVQFFESFYGNRSSSCRKLHNVVNSVIIFDEVQMFPTEYLKPVLGVIKELVTNYGCSAVLCTATQPVLSNELILGRSAIAHVREIIPDPKKLYNQFKRVQVNLLKENLTSVDIAKHMAKYEQILTIVNTRKDAREIMVRLAEITKDDANYHLSTMMCPMHRGEILYKIRARLDKGESCRVVSTQLIEAGVDIDFPVVYRAVAGLDSIAQAAGRCNRNGKLDKGSVFVFKGESKPPVGYLRQSAESGERTLGKYTSDPLSMDAVTEYFRDFYWKQNNGHNMDKHKIMSMLRTKPEHISFKDISRAFKIIQNEDQSVIIPYGQAGKKLVRKLEEMSGKLKYLSIEEFFLPREIQKRSQRFSVQLRKNVFGELAEAGAIQDVFDDGQYWILVNSDIYKESVGLTTDSPEYMRTESLIL